MKCLDCDKVRKYPILERGTSTPICPVCFGSRITDVSEEELEMATVQRWYFDKPDIAKPKADNTTSK